MNILGIDIGGSGIKGAPVDTSIGTFSGARHRIPTPKASTPDAVAGVIVELVQHFSWENPIGCTFPAIVKNGVVYSAANVDDSWIGVDAKKLFEERTGLPTTIINDADAAGIAEMQFGAGKGVKGVVILLTLGTGIGSAFFVNGHLLPNTEMGHMQMRGGDAEDWASDRTRKKQNLKWKEWAARVDEYMGILEALFSPDLFIIGGGVSKKHEKFLPYLTVKAKVVPAALLNDAGIVGAAIAAKELDQSDELGVMQ